MCRRPRVGEVRRVGAVLFDLLASLRAGFRSRTSPRSRSSRCATSSPSTSGALLAPNRGRRSIALGVAVQDLACPMAPSIHAAGTTIDVPFPAPGALLHPASNAVLFMAVSWRPKGQRRRFRFEKDCRGDGKAGIRRSRQETYRRRIFLSPNFSVESICCGCGKILVLCRLPNFQQFRILPRRPPLAHSSIQRKTPGVTWG